MTVAIKAYLAIERALTDKLTKSWHVLAKQTFDKVKVEVGKRDYAKAAVIAHNLDLTKVIKDNRQQMRLTAYAGLLFGASRITKNPKDTVIAHGNYSRIVEDVVRQMEQTVKLNVEEKVRDSLLEYVYQADVADPRTPFFVNKAEWVKKRYDPTQPRAPEGDTRGGEWVSTKGNPAEKLATAQGNYNPVTEADVLSYLSEDQFEEYSELIKSIETALANDQETFKIHSDGAGGLTPEREALHDRIIDEYTKDIERFKPAEGERPTAIFLGGRGGSGKSSFNIHSNSDAGVYDKDKFMVLDCDDLKNRLALADKLPDGVRHQAALYHEESSMLAIRLEEVARTRKINVVLDQTLRSNKSSLAMEYKDSGFRVEGYYMAVPRAEAAIRAIQRYAHGGRLVPPVIILGNVNNEKNFDKMIPLFEKWAVYDNNVPQGMQPKLVAKGGK